MFKNLLFIILYSLVLNLYSTNSITDELLYLINYGSVKEIESLLNSQKIDINSKLDIDGNNALFYAVKANKFKLARFLIKNNISINNQNSNGHTALHLATARGYKDFVELLLKNNAEANLEDGNLFSALHYAAIKDKNQVVDLLIKNGASISCSYHLDSTELDCAIASKSKRCIELLKLIVLLDKIINNEYDYLDYFYFYFYQTLSYLRLRNYDYSYALIKDIFTKLDNIKKVDIILGYLDKQKSSFNKLPADIKPKILLLINFNKKLDKHFSGLTDKQIKYLSNNKELNYRLDKWDLQNYKQNSFDKLKTYYYLSKAFRNKSNILNKINSFLFIS